MGHSDGPCGGPSLFGLPTYWDWRVDEHCSTWLRRAVLLALSRLNGIRVSKQHGVKLGDAVPRRVNPPDAAECLFQSCAFAPKKGEKSRLTS